MSWPSPSLVLCLHRKYFMVRELKNTPRSVEHDHIHCIEKLMVRGHSFLESVSVLKCNPYFSTLFSFGIVSVSVMHSICWHILLTLVCSLRYSHVILLPLHRILWL